MVWCTPLKKKYRGARVGAPHARASLAHARHLRRGAQVVPRRMWLAMSMSPVLLGVSKLTDPVAFAALGPQSDLVMQYPGCQCS